MSQTESPELGAFLEVGGVRFRCFTAAAECSVQLVNEDGRVLHERSLEPLGGGYFEALVSEAGEHSLYFFVVDGRQLPDPHARFLPLGVHGPARVEGKRYEFFHPAPQRQLSQLVIYELHIGTFTEAGTFIAARERLADIAALGVTAVQLMPVAAFAGERGWGYDGVALYAPHAAYGTPDELRELVDVAHALGLCVLLDVVYNHFGPAGNYLTAYSPDYFSKDVHNAWGQAPNYAHPALRRLMVDNARYWFSEFGFDGLRLDATHAILDTTERHLLEELVAVAQSFSPPRWLIAEDERNLADLITSTGLSALWADDFHHQVRVTLTGERTAYFAAFEPTVHALAQAINSGWLYSGQLHPISNKPRGTPASHLPAETLVYCIQNHDQIGNRAMGDRFPPGELFRAASLLLLFLPMTPLLFMGQEWAAATPFLYFTDHDEELGRLVREGRRREFAAFHEFAGPDDQARIPDPQDRETFLASKLRWEERGQPEQARTLDLYRTALALRRADEVWSSATRQGLTAEAVGSVLVVQRSRGEACRVLIMNLGSDNVPLSKIVTHVGLRHYYVQVQSSGAVTDLVPPATALVLAG
jgi:maltooligosyltrehalose trehalohydrolase